MDLRAVHRWCEVAHDHEEARHSLLSQRCPCPGLFHLYIHVYECQYVYEVSQIGSCLSKLSERRDGYSAIKITQ